MWGVGTIFYELCTGRPMFPGSNAEDELHLIFRLLGSPKPEVSLLVSDLKLAYMFEVEVSLPVWGLKLAYLFEVKVSLLV